MSTSIAHATRPASRASGGTGAVLLVVALLGLVAVGCGTPDSNSSETTQPRGAQGSTVGLDDTTPQPGGSVTFGMEADSDGFDPVANRWAISGTMVAFAVYDTLAAFDADGNPQPYLAEKLEHDPTGTTWTIVLRKGVTFSDGSPLTADAVKQVLDAMRGSLLVGPALRTIQEVSVRDDLTAVVKMSSPWYAFPTVLTSQIGVVPKPSTLVKAADGSPTQAAANPIGTGPFIQTEWTPNQRWKGTRNAHYWRKDAAGVQLPYLDEVTFRPIVESTQRVSALESGDVQMIHTDDPPAIKKLREQAAQGQWRMVEDAGEGEEQFVMFNVTKAPVDDVDIRRALVAAVDTEDYSQVTADGLFAPATSPFREGSTWYAPTPGYPSYDPTRARQLVDAYKAAHGGAAPSFTLKLGGTDSVLANQGQYLEQQWKAVGFDVKVAAEEQSTFITNAVTGNYQVQVFRQFGAPDPDFDYLWWTSENATGVLALNIARNQSACVDAAIKQGREREDRAQRKAAYAQLAGCFADELPYLWLYHVIWAVVASPKVHNISNGPLPDGKASMPLAAGDFGGVVRLTQTWVEH